MSALVYPKWFLVSKTVIINVLSLILFALPIISDVLTELLNLPSMAPREKAIVAVINIINIVIRFKTYVPVSVWKEAPAQSVQGPPQVGPAVDERGEL